jgi:AraC family transcriptional regulator
MPSPAEPNSPQINLESQLAFRHQNTKAIKPTLSHAKIFATSKTYGWDGLYAEVGENLGWHVQDMVPVGHYIAISRAAEDFHFLTKLKEGAWQKAVMPPGSLWIQPANQAFSFKVDSLAQWCGVVIQPAKLKSLIGSDSAVEAAVGLQDPILGAAMQAICAEVLQGGHSGTIFAQGMLMVLATQLLRLFGSMNSAPKGGITGRQMRLITDYVDTHLDQEVMISALAAQAGLSEAHFSRAFKQTIGLTPSRFITQRRLEKAKRLLADTDETMVYIALVCGFSDQAHFSRSFQQAFGISPTGLRKSYG